VTGFFSAHPASDPTAAGSRGAGVALGDGVRVTVSAGSGVSLNGESVEVDPVDRVLDALGVQAAVEAETSLPLGRGSVSLAHSRSALRLPRTRLPAVDEPKPS